MAPSCREIARRTYHFSEFCGIDWGWLHDAMRPNVATWANNEYFTHNNEKHGTVLSLLLKSVLELTLHRRQEDPNLLAHEINELLILEAGTDSNEPWKDSWFPFTLAANIQVPFDILLNLGVDIFSELSFDTWVLQIVLRKFLVNAVPWEHARRDKKETFTETDGLKPMIYPEIQLRMMRQAEDFSAMDPSFSNLYIFPGLSMFNHSCRPYENAQWGYDRKVPNRVVIWAHRGIKAGEEIRVPYQRYRIGDTVDEDTGQNMQAGQMFGKNCECPRCQGRGLVPSTGKDRSQFGSPDWTPEYLGSRGADVPQEDEQEMDEQEMEEQEMDEQEMDEQEMDEQEMEEQEMDEKMDEKMDEDKDEAVAKDTEGAITMETGTSGAGA
ncbi:uncharacterized protein N7515_009342 [Penicillium bovifimosum]|uniref:Histone-lysine N-methyltransferase SET5 n=1 Tax=Penicillium bovifimosum TaxID=126998 RepID=A0A9W9GJG1_9EURO|nr:uncharacterized protein N7515_009342 [Penicillium bovifimosum]KAJ5121381.1 hypothetical protein N7515_009342 [Penicillium bovifimosum]